MTITPFLTCKLRGKKDAILARQKARRIASLLCYPPHEQACIAAGVFVVACQGLALLGKARLCFQIENRQLQVFAQQAISEQSNTCPAPANRITEVLREVDPKTLYRLTKPLPPEQQVSEKDLGWLVHKVEETAPDNLFGEIVRQNQEILSLLHELRLFQGNAPEKEEKTKNPHAA
jgi:hypothetical protein